MSLIDKFIYCIVSYGKIKNFIISNKTKNIENMRKFHNFIKTQLIMYSAKNTQGRTLLDIAVGRGGDLFKWKQANFKIVIGFDNHIESLNEGMRRLSEQIKMKTKLPFVKYYNMSALDTDILTKLSKVEKNIKNLDIVNVNNTLQNQYDVVSCQFALHYFAENSQSLDFVLQMVSTKLKKDGLFIGTATDGDLINKNLENGNVNIPLLTLVKQFKNNYLFYIQTESSTSQQQQLTRQNYFELQGVSSEYYLFKETLITLAKKHDLELIEIKSFFDWYQDYKNSENFKKQQKSKNTLELSPYEMIISFLNFSFVFKKI